ncbi:MAG: helix-turn-helix domain-containing protein [Alphaproteobacteria bacterium]|nr:helix-turn-helix domain-containing protein [Alphaproteobacteria bacterium]
MARNVTRKPNPIDFHVGQRIRARRRELGLSQTVLGNEIGVSFKQVQKYESGANRIGAGRLYEISMALDTAVENFFHEAPLTIQTSVHSDAIKSITSIGIDQECEKLIEAYYSIPDRQLRQNFLSLLRTLSENE